MMNHGPPGRAWPVRLRFHTLHTGQACSPRVYFESRGAVSFNESLITVPRVMP